LFSLVADGANNVNPSMSPDGSRMVYVSDRDGAPKIYEYSFDTGETRRLTAGSGVYTNPQYNASGNSIAYHADLGNGSAVIQIMEANGQNAQTISDPASDIGNHAWSPDGGAIAYESNRSGNLDIYVYFVGNQRTRQLTSNSVPDYGATWYCNTLTLVFTSNSTGDPNLFAAAALPTDGAPIAVQPGINQLTREPSRDLYPVQTPPEENATVEDLAG
jgi:Tol biopolymer transport system component